MDAPSDLDRYAAQLEEWGELLMSLDLDVRLLSMSDGHPAPGLRIHLEDEDAELVCLYTPLGDVEGLEDLDLLNVVLTRNAQVPADRRSAVESVLPAVNEACPLGHFGMRADGDLYYRLEMVNAHGMLPDVAAFADALKLVSYADVVLRPLLDEVASGMNPDEALDTLRP
jgi:hypothetical protein